MTTQHTLATKFPALVALLGGYFNQDIYDLYDSPNHALDDYRATFPSTSRLTASQHLTELVADIRARNLSHTEYGRLLHEAFGCHVDPYPVSYETWLTHLATDILTPRDQSVIRRVGVQEGEPRSRPAVGVLPRRDIRRVSKEPDGEPKVRRHLKVDSRSQTHSQPKE